MSGREHQREDDDTASAGRLDGRLSWLLETVATSASDAVLITAADAIDELDGGPRIVYANDAFTRMTGYAANEVLGRTPRILQCEDTDRGSLDQIRSALERWERVEVELLNQRKDGRRFWVQVSIAPAIQDDGELTHWVSIQRDITARKHREDHEREVSRVTRERLRGAFQNAPIGMAVATPAGELLGVNPALAQLLGRSNETLAATTLFDLTHPDDLTAAHHACETLARRTAPSRLECRFRHATGRDMDVIVHASLVRDNSGDPDHVILHVEDVSERNALESELVRRALFDDLTRLPNRAMLLDRLNQAVARRNRDVTALALLFIDIDGFKEVNDTLGHAAGDALLIALARELEQSVRPGDTVARFGGDEFVVLCEHTDVAEAAEVAQRLSAAATRPQGALSGQHPSASIGLIVADGTDHAVPEAMLRDADAAMYEAKRLGPGQRVTFDTEMRARDDRRRAVESELRDALRRDELVLHYQPQIDLRTGLTVGVEALVRWNHPSRGLLAPHDFIPIAEQCGLIDDIGAWVNQRACADAATAGSHVVWVNVSAHQLQPGLVTDIEQLLEATGLTPDRFGLELTETVLMHDLYLARQQLTSLRALGVRLALDDFGTGYSSLSYLAELPVDTLKVDRSFAARLEPGGRGRTVITAILGMGNALGLDVIVEGVETADQLQTLKEFNTRLVQGHHLARPKPRLSDAVQATAPPDA